MDSTFLGGLAGLGLEMSKGQPGPAASSIELYNPSERILELLENLWRPLPLQVLSGRRGAASGQQDVVAHQFSPFPGGGHTHLP